MEIDVALVPALLTDPGRRVVLVVDVLRATTTLVAMLDAGAGAVAVCASQRQARRLAAERRWLLAGEVLGLPPPGFDHGNSPCEMADLDLRGRGAVLYTTNGTRAFGRAAAAPAVLAAALVNRSAAARQAAEEARRRDLDVCVLCAGLQGGRAVAAEDALAAGALVEALRDVAPEAAPGDGALLAQAAWQAGRGDVAGALRQTPHGSYLLKLGFARDLEYAARLDASATVPRLRVDGDVLLLEKAAS